MARAQTPTPQAPPPEWGVPIDQLLEAARSIPGWSLAHHETYLEGKQPVTRMRFSHRGGMVFPKDRLRPPGVIHLHEWVEHGIATVWVHWTANNVAQAVSDT